MARPLADALFTLAPRPEEVRPSDLLDAFLRFVETAGITLYPAQEEAVLEVFEGKNVILATPTGSGKSLVATAACFRARALGQRAFYTCPIKALVSEKFFALCELFGPDDVGMITGDASVNRDAPIICCTAEILANVALREGEDADVGVVVMDEFHFVADRERGTAWQVPLLALPRATFLLMSATIGPPEAFERALERRTGRPTAVVRSGTRPVPLTFEYVEKPLHETLASLMTKGRAPVYVVCFTQRAAAEQAQNMMSVDFLTRDEKRAVREHLRGVHWQTPYAKDVRRFLEHGVGLHHAGLLPKYRRLVERLAQTGLLRVIAGTDTLGVGVNIPIRTVLFTQLCKWDGEKTAVLGVRDFQQIAGRAGRKGFDDEGFVVAQAPEHVVENLRLEAKAGSDPAKRRKIVKKKPPERGYAPWDRETFERLAASEPERLVPRFAVGHGLVLEVLSRETGGCRALVRLLRNLDAKPAEKRALRRAGREIVRSLLDAHVLEVVPGSRTPRVNVDLQEDFSIHHALSLWLFSAIEVLDRESPTYALDVVTLVESMLENPDLLLERQLDRIKTQKLGEMKAAGVEYEERIAELEKLEWPKPLAELVYATFNEFAKLHPWVRTENIRPKSVAREMLETLMSFSDYVKEYGIERAEGLLLRYLSDVVKVLVQGVPEAAKTPELDDATAHLRAVVRSIDASLLDEWEAMREGRPAGATADRDAGAPVGEIDVTRDERAFGVLVRNAVFALVRALAARDVDGVLDRVEPDSAVGGRELAALIDRVVASGGRIAADPRARGAELFRIVREPGRWRVEQSLLVGDEASELHLAVDVDLEASREAGRPALRLVHAGA